MSNKHLSSDLRSALICFDDPELFRFITQYLNRRYVGFDDDPAFPFDSTSEFVEQMLNSLRIEGMHQTMDHFISGPMRRPFKILYAARVPYRFDFDAVCLLPLLERLPPDAVVLDFGAGNNHFLPAMASQVDRDDFRYLATDHFVDQPEHKPCHTVQFLAQPDPLLLPDTPPLDLILMRRVAHHLTDLQGVLTNIHGRLRPGGHLVLIEDTFCELPQDLPAEIQAMVDTQLTHSFRQTLSVAQRLTFLRFNDFYANHLFHGWTSMPLPLGHRTFDGWIEKLSAAGFRLVSVLDCGFPKGRYTLHQAATGILLFQKATMDT